MAVTAACSLSPARRGEPAGGVGAGVRAERAGGVVGAGGVVVGVVADMGACSRDRVSGRGLTEDGFGRAGVDRRPVAGAGGVSVGAGQPVGEPVGEPVWGVPGSVRVGRRVSSWS